MSRGILSELLKACLSIPLQYTDPKDVTERGAWRQKAPPTRQQNSALSPSFCENAAMRSHAKSEKNGGEGEHGAVWL